MYNYLDQIGHQELARQHFEQISQASAMARAAQRSGKTNFPDLNNKFITQYKAKLALITTAVLLAVLVISEAVAAAVTAIGSGGNHLFR